MDPFERIQDLRTARVLIDGRPAQLSPEQMVVAVTCGDGHRIRDIYEHTCGTHRCHIHLIAVNGGAIWLSDRCPNPDGLPRREVLMTDVIAACAIKGTAMVALGAHVRCAVAGRLGLDVDEILSLILDGRRSLKQRAPHLQAYCFLHVTHPDGRERTYSVDHKHDLILALPHRPGVHSVS